MSAIFDELHLLKEMEKRLKRDEEIAKSNALMDICNERVRLRKERSDLRDAFAKACITGLFLYTSQRSSQTFGAEALATAAFLQAEAMLAYKDAHPCSDLPEPNT